MLVGIVRALLWLGIRDYVEANQPLIQEIAERDGQSWYVVLDSDIADAMPGLTKSRWDTLGHLLSSERRRQIQGFQARQTDKKQVFVTVKAWLSRQCLGSGSIQNASPLQVVTMEKETQTYIVHKS